MSHWKLATTGLLIGTTAFAGCDSTGASSGNGILGSGGSMTSDNGGGGGANLSSGGDNSTGGRQPLNKPSGPRYHPPEGFEDCVHAPVKKNCADGWCTLPPSCFVMGSPEDEWHRGRLSETRTAVTLTHAIDIQQKELTRAEWLAITNVVVAPPASEVSPCLEDTCPISNITWWEAVEAANMLSVQKGFAPCYEPVDCKNELGQGRFCQGVQDSEKSVYECEGYRLPTRAEAEYAARAGTISTFYSGDITLYDTYLCAFDENLDKIAWYCHNSNARVHEGGQKEPNDFGLYDMISNVREWVNDGNRIGSTSGGTNPDGIMGMHVERLTFVGHYKGEAMLHRTASIQGVAASGRGSSLGVRFVRTLPE